MAGYIRIGIDVGGTFTHAVALDGNTLEIAGKAKVPTTHRAPEGVAAGIIQSLQALLQQANISPENVGFIAHSTTQATNALLEGDVAPVGILGLGKGANAWLARLATNIQKLELAPGKFLNTFHEFIDSSSTPSDETIKAALNKLVEKGARAIAVSEAFGVDAPENEQHCLDLARNMGLLATSGSEVSQMYGLKVRTRTAVINASMLPKMIESANMTETSVRGAGIKAPIMIMRSDGGVMDIDAMRRRPILTMLSGPAAGVAAAMMYLHISDGIFLEVGGTSTDISAIRNGRALVKSAEVGGHRVYMRTLDVHTVGVAGGSIPRMAQGSITDIGPRSAHIAGLKYVCFSDPLDNPRIQLIQPQATDARDYVAIADGDKAASLCLTPTCAANFLNLVPAGDPAAGNAQSAEKALAVLAREIGGTATDAAQSLLEQAGKKCQPTVSRLIKDYKLDPSTVTLVGGGGGAAALVPFLAKHMQMRHSLAQNADVISAIGVALALVRETVERQIVNPSNEDLLRIRQEAQDAVHKMGADPSTIDILVEVDSRTNTVRATASGATALAAHKKEERTLAPEERLLLAADSMRASPSETSPIARTSYYEVFQAATTENHLGGLFAKKCNSLRVLDADGVVRLQVKNGQARLVNVAGVDNAISELAEQYAEYGDAGRVLPAIMLLAGPKIVDLSGLMDLGQIITLSKIETDTLPRESQVIVLASLLN